MGKPTTRQNRTQTVRYSPPNSPKTRTTNPKRHTKRKTKVKQTKPTKQTRQKRGNIFAYNQYMQKRLRENRANPEWVAMQTAISKDVKRKILENKKRTKKHNLEGALPLSIYSRNAWPDFFKNPEYGGKLNKTKRKQRKQRKQRPRN